MKHMGQYFFYLCLIGALWCLPNSKAPAQVGDQDSHRAALQSENLQLWKDAEQLRNKGMYADAAKKLARILAIEEERTNPGSAAILMAIKNLAFVFEEGEDWTSAKEWRDAAYKLTKKYRGENDWETVTARVENQNLETLLSLNPADRMKLQNLKTLLIDYNKFYEASNFTDALPRAVEILRIQSTILGAEHSNTANSTRALAHVYYGLGETAKAQPLYEQTLATRKKIYGEEHPEVAASLSDLGGLYEALGDYNQAFNFLSQALKIHVQTIGSNHPDFSVNMVRLMQVRMYIGKYYPDTDRHLLKALTIIEKNYGENHAIYANCLATLGYYYKTAGNYKSAESFYVRSSAAKKKVYGEKHRIYALSLHDLGMFYHFNLSDYDRAEPLYQQALSIIKEAVGDQHPYYASVLSSLATLHANLANFQKAIDLMQKALAIQKLNPGEHHPLYASTLSSMGRLYINMGDYSQAEAILKQAETIILKNIGSLNPHYAALLADLALVHQGKGRYANAKFLTERSLEITKEVLGEDHPYFANQLANLGRILLSMGDYAESERHLRRAQSIVKNTLGDKHIDYASILTNLGTIYRTKGDYQRAVPLFLEAQLIIFNSVGTKHPLYAQILVDNASLFEALGDFQKAEELLKEAAEITKNALGDEHFSYANNRFALASLYFNKGDYTKAEPLFQECQSIVNKIFGDRHPYSTMVLSSLAALYQSLKDYTKADFSYRLALINTNFNLDVAALGQSERQQLALNQSVRVQIDHYISLGLNSHQFEREIFAQVLSWKGATLVRQQAMRQASKDPGVAKVFQELQQIVQQASALSRAMPIKLEHRESWKDRMQSLNQEKEKLEEKLSQKSASFRFATRPITLENLIGSLPADSLLIDFFEISRPYPPEGNRTRRQWQRELVAFVVIPDNQADQQVHLIELGNMAQISEAIATWRKSFGVTEESISAGQLLRKKLWEPLNKFLDGTKTILISTDGALGNLPFGALPGKSKGSYLLEDHRIALIAIPRMLPSLMQPEAHQQAGELLLIGDVNYNSEQMADAAPGTQSPGKKLWFGRLQGTEKEISAIADLYHNLFPSHETKLRTLTSDQASEANFRTFSPLFKHIHIATHGFFAEEGTPSEFSGATRGTELRVDENNPIVGNDPMLLSGLAFAGANRIAAPDADDGLLLAQEISFQPLLGVDTVVLSACDTGRGKVAGGEGLLGIQRAFQLAGVRTTIASHWKVNDEATNFLMTHFYRNLWEKKMSRLDSLRDAQLFLLNNPSAIGKDNSKRTSPKFWAAFSLSGDWR